MPKLPLMHAFPWTMPAVRPEILLERAGTLCRAGNREQAREICRQILQAHPLNLGALNLMGVTFAEEGLFHEAIEHGVPLRIRSTGDSIAGAALDQHKLTLASNVVRIDPERQEQKLKRSPAPSLPRRAVPVYANIKDIGKIRPL